MFLQFQRSPLSRSLFVAVVLLCATTACGASGNGSDTLNTPDQTIATEQSTPQAAPSQTPPSATPNSPTNASFAGKEWNLAQFGAADQVTKPLADAPITVLFQADGTVSGNAGCNSFFGNYTISEQSLQMTDMGGTLMACEEAKMQQEEQFLAALRTVSTFKLQDQELTLQYDGGALVFTLAPSRTDQSLIGQIWNLEGFQEGNMIQSLLNNTTITIEFSEDAIQGTAGCNRYNASYTMQEQQLTIENIASTKRGCPDSATMEQEQGYLAALQTVTEWEISGDRLILQHDGGGLHFIASET
ncbi:MAG: META domain-containing protein [Chloroflexales bacterium]|nr:META domain-containing protein [Chloroflexales bacterium]